MQAVLISPHPDETDILRLILQQAGFMHKAVRSLDHAIEAWPENPAEFILIVVTGEHPKVMLKVSQLRAHTVVPILLISDPLPENVYVDYLEAGADLVVFRPYSVRALLATIRAIMRRGTGVPFFSLPILSQREVVLDPASRTVQVKEGEPKKLTQLEFRLLYTLMTHAGQIIPTEEIVENVWGYTGDGNRDLVRGLVQRLRSKVETDPHKPAYILTEVGVGYYFQN